MTAIPSLSLPMSTPQKLILNASQADMLVERVKRAMRALIDKGYVESENKVLIHFSAQIGSGLRSCDEDSFESVESLSASTDGSQPTP